MGFLEVENMADWGWRFWRRWHVHELCTEARFSGLRAREREIDRLLIIISLLPYRKVIEQQQEEQRASACVCFCTEIEDTIDAILSVGSRWWRVLLLLPMRWRCSPWPNQCLWGCWCHSLRGMNFARGSECVGPWVLKSSTATMLGCSWWDG